MKRILTLLAFISLSQVNFAQSHGNCSCSCQYSIQYDQSIEGKEMKLSSYKFDNIKPKEAEKWSKELGFKGNDPITVSNVGLSEILDKICSKKSKGKLMLHVEKEADDFVKLVLGYERKK